MGRGEGRFVSGQGVRAKHGLAPLEKGLATAERGSTRMGNKGLIRALLSNEGLQITHGHRGRGGCGGKADAGLFEEVGAGDDLREFVI